VSGSSLYFVAKGDGSHVFSADLESHNSAVREFQLKRRADYRSSPAPVLAPAVTPTIESKLEPTPELKAEPPVEPVSEQKPELKPEAEAKPDTAPTAASVEKDPQKP
jgi:UPF0755 protein